MTTSQTKVRLDKWLWAARFFKTRRLAKEAILAGKVHSDGQRLKVAKELAVGETLEIRQGFDVRTVRVMALSEQRRGAPEAALLYQETEESIELRTALAADRKAARAGFAAGDRKPTKKERRQIHRFVEKNNKL